MRIKPVSIRHVSGFLAAVSIAGLVSLACVSNAPELGEEPPPVVAVLPSTSPTPSVLRRTMVLPTMAPGPATRNPVGLPPVKVATAAADPVIIRIQAIGVDLDISESALTSWGALAAPTDTLGVVWYKDGAKPGMVGNAVLTGHLDWSGKPGAFFRLKELVPGDIIQVWTADGKEFLYSVESSKLYKADDAPVADIMGAKETPLLTLITCEGSFDYAKHDYSHRRVVRAIWY